MLAKLCSFRLLLVAGFVFFTNVLMAQQRTVSGKITDAATGAPVNGSTIAVRGSNVATESNAEGKFTITVPNANSRLIISFVGFEPQEFSTTGKDNITVGLKSTTSSLNEVVVTGYTSQKKKEITGSVSVVNVKDLKQTPVGTGEEAL
ncbi:MAG: carboxypeptidase-like regulatory domain-containing protein, partial [Ferruginibacter sp.]